MTVGFFCTAVLILLTGVSAGHAASLTTLASFNGTNGELLEGALIADAAGDLFGTTFGGGANGDNGTVFELVNNGGGSHTLITLVSFNGPSGRLPHGSLIADAAGNLFGTTFAGGANGDHGTVFELVNNGGGSYTLTTLVSFNGTNGNGPDCRSDRRRRREPLQHDNGGRGVRCWHSVRDRQDGRQLRQHADHSGQLQRHQRE